MSFLKDLAWWSLGSSGPYGLHGDRQGSGMAEFGIFWALSTPWPSPGFESLLHYTVSIGVYKLMRRAGVVLNHNRKNFREANLCQASLSVTRLTLDHRLVGVPWIRKFWYWSSCGMGTNLLTVKFRNLETLWHVKALYMSLAIRVSLDEDMKGFFKTDFYLQTLLEDHFTQFAFILIFIVGG
uniref:Uncharacterized protein n=1 Tax=Ananas comosus var. bracteatus TaxID=296719 RepID=A0A6V7Q8A0_ANACO|nr:unnamed protein product [Ananas comosus var. bracteatus]